MEIENVPVIEQVAAKAPVVTENVTNPAPATPAAAVTPATPVKKGDFAFKSKTPVTAAVEATSAVEPKVVTTVTPAVEVVPADGEGLDFGLSVPEAPATTASQVTPATPTASATELEITTDWKSVLKSVKREDILKELGIDEPDDFEKEFRQFRKNGGDPYKYLEAKSKDWNKVDDATLAMQMLAEASPSLNREELELLFNDKYNQDEFSTEDEKRLGAIKLKNDADQKRRAEIENQKKFVIPEVTATNPEQVIEQFQAEMAEQQKQTIKAANDAYLNDPSTQALISSKKVTIPAGEYGDFNVRVNTDDIVGYFTNPEIFKKYSFDAQGKPDIQKEQALAMIKIIGLSKYNETLINFGKEQAKKAILEEGQNIGSPKPQPAVGAKKPVQWRST